MSAAVSGLLSLLDLLDAFDPSDTPTPAGAPRPAVTSTRTPRPERATTATPPTGRNPMSPVHAVRSALRQYAVFTGRASRPELWWFAAAYLATAVVTSVIDTVLFGQVAGLVGVMPLTWAVIVASIVPMLAVAVRRLHDSGRSGWWYLVQAVPFAGPVWLLVLLCAASDPLPNAYGAPRTAGPVDAGAVSLAHGRA